MYLINDIRQIINDYHWKKRLIQSQVYEMDSTSSAQYGIESAMPKAQGETGDKVASIVLRNDNERRKIESLVREVEFIDQHEKYINSDKNYHILQLLKQGESKQRIKVLLNIGSRNLYERIDQIVIILFNAQSDKKETKEIKETKET
ncbi:hypothetical protein [Salinicoccus roseus]|uniref:hypothetical protein n=1 Tax=Salinicoccus roseus TaxID=45670 RepID=UPI002301DAE9|nr:hypothetical protein [Salinicoccus roseus]